VTLSNKEPLLKVDLRHRQGPLSLSVNFVLTQPWTVLFGPSGSGKSTVLRTIAGFVRPDEGQVTLGTQALVDTARKVFVPAHLRELRSAGQAARLFSTMSVRENLRYGIPETDAEELLLEVLRLFRLERLADKMPDGLSGGEQQRVSVARAVASAVAVRAKLLLLDEPFAGLDFALRDQIVMELQGWLHERQVQVLSVTHDVGEVFLLDAEAIRMEDGLVIEQGAVKQVLAGERLRLLRQL